jgi:tetratricopeptide (TPR) repeat protein
MTRSAPLTQQTIGMSTTNVEGPTPEVNTRPTSSSSSTAPQQLVPHRLSASSEQTQTQLPNHNLHNKSPSKNKPTDVDNFLAGPSHRTHSAIEEPGQLPLLKPPPLPKASSDYEQLFLLAQRRAWNDVLRLGLDLLTGGMSPYQRHYSQLLQGVLPTKEEREQDQEWNEFEQIVRMRLRAMIYLRRFTDLRMEVRRLHLLPYQEKSGDMPLPLVLEAIESLVHGAISSNADGSISGENVDLDGVVDQMYALREKLKREDDWVDWIMRLDIVLCNILVRKQEWRLALKTLEDVLEYAEDVVSAHVKKTLAPHASGFMIAKDALVSGVRIEVYSRQGKILLQAGALPAAASIFERAHDEFQLMKRKRNGNVENNPQLQDLLNQSLLSNAPTQILLNEGLLHYAHMDYDLAAEKFQKGLELQRQVGMPLIFAMNRNTLKDVLEPEEELLVPCLNNLALCAMYTCRMRDAVSMMEALIRENPTRYLTECMAFNLCTLYELGSDNSISDHKKKTLQLVAKRFSLHDVGNDSFRLVK